MKRNLTKIGALVLSIMLCLCGTLGVFAAAPEGKTPLSAALTGGTSISITTEDVDGKDSTLTANAYQFITVNTDDSDLPAAPLYKWSSPSVADWVAANYPEYAVMDGETATLEVAQAYIDLANSTTEEDKAAKDEAMKAFAGALSAAVKKGDIALDAAGTATLTGAAETAERTGSINGLMPGSYLVLITGGEKIYSPSIANLIPEWTKANEETGSGAIDAGWYVDTVTTLNVKSSPVTITKTPTDPTVAIGDNAEFTIVATVPQYPAGTVNTKFIIRDTLSKGLKYNEGSVKVYGVIDGSEDELLAEDTNYTFTYTALEKNAETNPKENSGTFDVVLTGELYETVKHFESVKVVYTAKITADAVVGVEGNPNDAALEYNNDPYDDNSSTTKTTETKVYTYGLDLTKTNDKTGDELEYLAGAEFSVTKNGETTPMAFVSEASGAYRVAAPEEIAVEGDANITTTTVVTAANGKLDIRGLDVGTYTIKETKAPDGYVLLSGTVDFTITDEKSGEEGTEAGPDGIAEDDNAIIDEAKGKLGYVGETITNKKGFSLPLTGGMGTVLFTAGGIVLIALAAVLLFAANRKKSSRD